MGEVLDVMRQLAEDGMTTHEMGCAREVGDTLVFMGGGGVVESGMSHEVLADPQHPRTRAFLNKVRWSRRVAQHRRLRSRDRER